MLEAASFFFGTSVNHIVYLNIFRGSFCRSQWTRVLRRRSAAVLLLKIVGSNPTGGMDVCLLRVLCVVRLEVSATSGSVVQRSPTDCGASLCVIYKSRE
jgi:hypothetical protein